MSKNPTDSDLLKTGNRAGVAIHSADWTHHPLGPPDRWAPVFHITLNIILHSDFPMLLFWGPEFFCFYNDVSVPSLKAAGKHPEAIGKPAKDVWPETWETLKTSIDQVLKREEAVTFKNHLLSDFHNNFSLSPVKDETGSIAGILAICRESTPDPEVKQELKETHEEKISLLESITDGYFEINENWIISHCSKEAGKLLGINHDDIPGVNIWDILSEEKKLKFFPEYQKAMEMKQGTSVSFEEYYEQCRKWFSFSIYPTRRGISVYFQDITRHRRLQLINERTEEISGVAGWELDLLTKQVYLTPKAYEIYDLSRDQPIDLEINKELYDEKALYKIKKAVERAIDWQEAYEIELKLTSKINKGKIVRINGFPVIEKGSVTKLYGTLKDVTQEKKEKEELNEAIRKLKAAQKIAKMGYWTADIIEDKGYWSTEVCNIFGVDPVQFKPSLENWLARVHPEDRDSVQLDFNTIFTGNRKYYDFDHRIITPDGTVKWILERITLHRDESGAPRLLEGISQDITEKKKQEEKVLQALQEKETLLAEIHHRVKNNLAVISSMVQLQAYEEESEQVKEKLMDSAVRIISMASIHEHLYQSNSFSKLELSKSLKKLIVKIVEAMQSKIKIKLDFNLGQVYLNINQAIPCSLIVNEVITNIVKHAFQNKSEGKVTVTLAESNNRVNLSIRDNGVGMPKNFKISESKTMGLRLITTLAKQLNAVYQYNSVWKGTFFSIQFEKLEIKGAGNANL